MAKKHIRSCAILHFHNKKYWSFEKLANQFGVSIATITKWSKTAEWQDVGESYNLIEYHKEKESDAIWQDKHLQDIQDWQESQKTFARYQMGLAIQLSQVVGDIIKNIKENEALNLETLKQLNNFNSLASAVDKFHARSTDAMTQVLSIDRILNALESPEPRQLELDLGN